MVFMHNVPSGPASVSQECFKAKVTQFACMNPVYTGSIVLV